MNQDRFGEINSALAAVTGIARQLRGGGPEADVRLSAEALVQAFARREPVEPAVNRLQRSVSFLDPSQIPEHHAADADEPLLRQLETAIEAGLLPELRRVGFEV
jgi:hypothetical protein